MNRRGTIEQTRFLRAVLEEGKLMTYIRNFLIQDDGATLIEYGLIAALIAIAAVTALGTVGTNLTSKFSTIATTVSGGSSS